ncbi:RecQ family ATP-dependent DNA helicase [Salibacterium aidingense]|uniref:RecQ family ATP-dependent DNA helicase n=1 Tax=Salibacterium aidingense TaxID=384933 RepID=UPI000408B9C5|nr:ATP-dependent DNA helicase RecQ [Salibacterium aidingense]
METLDNFLKKTFGFTSFKHNQRCIIEAVLQDRDVFAMQATGAGKSLCYQLPALWKEGTAVIISPLLSLMENQVQELKQMGMKRVAAYNSFLTPQEKQYILKHLSSYKIIYISPESVQQPDFLSRLQDLHVSLLAVDEAHCISQWGHEFRTDYLKIKEVRRQSGNPPCLALTATAAEEVRQDVMEKLGLSNPVVLCDSVDRPNISLYVDQQHLELEKREALKKYVSNLSLPGMVYVSSRHKAEELSEIIRRETSLQTSAYHGGMTKEDRHLIQQQFLSGEIEVICCTNAFGMGINKPDIRFVIHFHFSKDIESFMQEIGRAGRDGNQSFSILLYSEQDGHFPRKMIEKEFPTEQEVKIVCDSHPSRGQNELTYPLLLETYGMEEVHARFFYYYWIEAKKAGNQNPQEYILAVIRRRKEWKHKKLVQMEQWISRMDRCRRQTLLEAFGEFETVSPELCCDNCGHSLPLRKTANRSKKADSISWEKRLQALLHQLGNKEVEEEGS